MSSDTLIEENLKIMAYFHDGSASTEKIKRDRSDDYWCVLASIGGYKINKTLCLIRPVNPRVPSFRVY